MPIGAGSKRDATQQQAGQPAEPELVVVGVPASEQQKQKQGSGADIFIDWWVKPMDSSGNLEKVEPPMDHPIAMKEEQIPNAKGKMNKDLHLEHGTHIGKGILSDHLSSSGKGYSVVKRFEMDARPARVYNPAARKAYDYVRVDASSRHGIVLTYANDSNSR